jgi:hypothetical protein
MSAKSHSFGVLLASALFAVATAASAQTEIDGTVGEVTDTAPSTGAIAADVLILRPLSLIGTVLGTAVFVVGLPFEAIAGDVSDPARRLVVEPAKYTFTRPLGESGRKD